MKQNKFPPGWDEKHIQSIISDYKQQTEDEAVTEDEAASQNEFGIMIRCWSSNHGLALPMPFAA